ncbi:ZPR1 zinc-finger domain-containing protein [Paraphysoderma sedebokerense]|nr:ZPR1 zinc-finger domain-containing protein [Paraphysoderma sedebokerense]
MSTDPKSVQAESHAEATKEPLFNSIDGDQQVTEIESYCVNCHENGITRLLLTKIPHFREIIVMAFECPHCGFRNNEIQSAGVIQEKGSSQTCRIDGSKKDLNRQIVKSESASVKIHEIDLEIPAKTGPGLLTTAEGLLSDIIDDLSEAQPLRKYQDEATYNKIEAIISKLRTYMEGNEPFTITVDDIAGNSYIENLCAPNPDPQIKIKHYNRTPDQDAMLGLSTQPASEGQADSSAEPDAELTNPETDIPEILHFPANCSSCNAPGETKMHVMDIPYFKQVVIMSTSCDYCGYKSNEVKAGGPISEKGKKITLKVVDQEDLSRDILKSETCGLTIPEIDLHLTPGTLGGRFTTVEGLLTQVLDELENRTPFAKGDSVGGEKQNSFKGFLNKLRTLLTLSQPFTLILDDPLANSYLQNLYAPDPDPNMEIEYYERTWDQNEDLGLNDLVLEGYENADEQTRESGNKKGQEMEKVIEETEEEGTE